MIKNSVLNFLKNLKYVFTPLGILFLFFILGLSAAIPMMLNAVKTAFDEVASALSKASFDWHGGLNSLLESISSLSWNDDSGKAFSTLISSDFLNDALLKAVKVLFGEGSVTVQETINAVQKCVATLGVAVVVFLIFVVLGLIVGYLFTRFFIRGEITKGKWWKVLLMVLLDTTVNLLLFIGTIMLMSIWDGTIFISVILAMLIYSVFSLFEAYLVYGIKKVAFKKVFHPLNFLYLILSDLIIIAITAVMILPLFLLMNPIGAFFVIVPLVEIAFIVGSLNSESYVIKCVNDEKNNEPIETKINKKGAKKIEEAPAK